MQEGHEDEGGKNFKTVQIFVKMDGSGTIVMDGAPNDKVSEMKKRIRSGGDMYVTSGGRVLRRSDKLKSCGVYDGSTVQVMSRMRGGGRPKDKKSKADEKRDRDESGRDGQQQEEQVDSVSVVDLAYEESKMLGLDKKAVTHDRTRARQESAFRRSRTVSRRAGGDEYISRGENRKMKRRPRPRGIGLSTEPWTLAGSV